MIGPREKLSKFDALFVQAIQKSKLNSFNGAVITFSGLIVKFGRMRAGFLELEQLFDALKMKTVNAQQKGSGNIDIEHFKTKATQLPCQTDGALPKILQSFDDKSFIDSDDFLMIFCILYLMDGPGSISSPALVQSLLIIEQSFSCFDVSSDGTLQREELIAALEKNGGSSVNLGSEGGNQRQVKRSASSKKKSRKITGPASLLFDALDLDKSGEITFKEFLLGLRQIVMETENEGSFKEEEESNE